MNIFQGEFMFLAVVAIPTFVALVAWVLNRSISVDAGRSHAPANYWGAYHSDEPAPHLRGVPLPENPYEEVESTMHAHTIGVHP
jgi:hypothetical protein